MEEEELVKASENGQRKRRARKRHGWEAKKVLRAAMCQALCQGTVNTDEQNTQGFINKWRIIQMCKQLN